MPDQDIPFSTLSTLRHLIFKQCLAGSGKTQLNTLSCLAVIDAVMDYVSDGFAVV
ncbi:hypothetical protein XHC_3985 [Xanthomonas hortorum pv. carotae str. M081]|nr:hypothetical protein XHC_3985 [Xanthomonas hortorum pv. carotae str. M081]